MDNSIFEKLEILLEKVGDMSLKRRARKIINELNLKEGDRIIDIGCGDGFYLYLLSNLPIKLNLVGFDYDQIVLTNARKNLASKKIKLVQGSATDMPFKSGEFAKAIMTEVLEHIDDDEKALNEVFRILKPKGVLFLTVPNYRFPFLWDPINWLLQNIFGTHIEGTGFLAGIWARHLRLYKKEDLERIIKKSGFKIEVTEQLTTRSLPFNHHLVNLVARLLYDVKPSSKISDPLSKFKNAKKPFLVKVAFFIVNMFDKLNDIFPGEQGLNLYIKAIK